MILGKSFLWYVRYIAKPFLAATVVLIGLELISNFFYASFFSLVLSTPLSWLVKLTASFIIGYSICQSERRVLQAIAGGILLGFGIGIVSIGINIYRLLTLKPNLFGFFGILDIFFIVLNEVIIGAFFAAVGGILAGGRLEKLEL